MEFTSRTLTSEPGLSQEEALTTLQEHPLFKAGTRIASIRRQGNRWVVKLLEPKIAGPFPPSGDEEEESGPPKPEPEEGEEEAEEGGPPEGDEGEGGPPKPGGDKGGEKADIGQLLHLVTQICDALGIAPSPEGMGGPDALGPGPDGPGGPPMPPHGGPPGMGGPPPHGPHPGGPPPGGGAAPPRPIKLKPGEVPMKPGVTPVGSPAFASVHQAQPAPTQGVPPRPTQPAAAPTCSRCGGPMANGGCPTCQSQGIVGQAATFVASCEDPRRELKMAAAKAELESAYSGYRVKQIKRDGQFIRAMLSVR